MSAKFKLCPQCRGSGMMVMRAASVWTQSDRDDDPDGFDDMMDGRYDVACDRCGGLRVVDVKRERAFADARREHFEMLREQGIGPGSPDWF